MKNKSLEDLTSLVVKFRDERNWKQFHNPKDLALSLSLEVSELLENFQWQTSEEAVAKNLAQMKEELADVLMYALLFAHETGIDITQVIEEKLQKNNEKYPVEKAYGVNTKYTEL
ncbi:nucleotide pyrophosphohydrolase [Bacillus cereus]|uniref:nucleotide pyrophosphohydrolase n=1 Tax=Bacillus cereus TaxID=1396 RepID=UPI000BF71312|nr:nucleotide pyrophosphohydrolase [Bacillus cereus]PFK30591.1 nucleotide pyrophosphohydrolase [Bacillus cereus]PFR14221.1 nucleotide pyrophosphohydrolase [Bacillus cereus]